MYYCLGNHHLTWGDEHQLKAQVGDLRGVPVPVPLRQPAGHHVAVIDRLHLVHVVALNPKTDNYCESLFLKRDFCAI